VGFSHYPKTVGNIVMAWVQPAPPDVPPDDGLPDFIGMPFSEINLWREPIAPGKSVIAYHDAQPFTKFYGSACCDQSLEVTLTFSNDEVDANGHWITDENIHRLHYDVLGQRQNYDPTKSEQTSKIFALILGRWLRVEIKNTGKQPSEFLRAYIRGSVF
jgi:hypothetical protein